MRISNDGKRTERRRNRTEAAPLAEISTDRDEALGRARGFGAAGLRTTLSWQIARTLFRIGFAGSLAVFAGRLIEDAALDVIALAGALACLALSTCAGVFADLAAASAEDHVVNRMRTALQDTLSLMSPVRIRTKPAGALVAGLQRYPGALAGLVISHSAAKSMLAIAPLLAAVAVAVVSWQAALMLFLAVPIMIVFFVLLGGVVRSRAEAQEKAFGRLAAQFSDRIRTLPTILANHALLREHGKIEQRMTLYADSTMAVLKVAFLNAGIIDFFSAIAIAVLAVFLGLSHLGLLHIPGFSGLALWQSLFILIIAAEFFTPFRRYAEQYHVKAEGQAAARELDWYFDESGEATTDAGNADTRPFAVAGTFDAADLPRSGLIAISGPSGSGKSTLLRMLAGIETPPPDFKPLPQVTADGCDWISTDIYVPAGTLAEAIAWNRGNPERSPLQAAAAHVGLLDERLLPGGLDARIAEGGDNLSGGQRMRVGIARIMLSGGVVLADEPTAKLDPRTAKLVRQVLTDMAKRRLIIVATHDERLIEAASRHHVLRSPSQAGQAVAA
ncbi:ATP-binding cassette domain-containing protein [Bradyrhizobium sp.]|uniref:ATP-binding cassette domain-containing protein n=1 Tax=Bradyrhizobium sp. TaxID=376 RepID=UPI0025B7CF9B|nr:ATP-binding cassette domain-containing protein [Bradyrhizobium sp.]